MSTVKIHRYEGNGIVVTYEARRCIHAARCTHGLPAVFDPNRKPWVDAKAAPADAVARAVEGCPTGALQYERRDGGPQEAAAVINTIQVSADGPLFLRGRVRVNDADGQPVVRDTRVALCRCGQSAIKPFCDGSHTKAGFREAGAVAKPQVQADPAKAGEGALDVSCSRDGSLAVTGVFDLVGAKGAVVASGNKTWLCRCGGSAAKPFCDGTHKKIGFKAS